MKVYLDKEKYPSCRAANIGWEFGVRNARGRPLPGYKVAQVPKKLMSGGPSLLPYRVRRMLPAECWSMPWAMAWEWIALYPIHSKFNECFHFKYCSVTIPFEDALLVTGMKHRLWRLCGRLIWFLERVKTRPSRHMPIPLDAAILNYEVKNRSLRQMDEWNAVIGKIIK